MKHTLVRIPNCFIDLFTGAAELKLACAFYGLINANTEKDLMGNYIISVSQKTLASLCGCSEMTIRRTAAKLVKAGFICSQHRPVSNRRRDDGVYLLDKYVYTISCISCETDYFQTDKAQFSRLSGQAFRVYILFCKLADSVKHYFYHSLTDLCSMLRISRSDLSETIKAIENLQLIKKLRKRTHCGDFTENTYIIIVYVPGRIHKKRKRVKEISPCAGTQGAEHKNNRFPSSVIILMINHFKRFVKGVYEKIKKFFDFWGSG